MSKINQIVVYIEKLESQFVKAIALDHELKIDAYENVGRLKICQKIQKFIDKLQTKEVS